MLGNNHPVVCRTQTRRQRLSGITSLLNTAASAVNSSSLGDMEMDSEQHKTETLNLMKRRFSNSKDAEAALAVAETLLDLMFPTKEAIAGTVRSFTTVSQLPEELWCLYHRGRDNYYELMTLDEPSVKCFVVMAKRFAADCFVLAIDEKPIPTAVTFEELKDIAEERGMDALLLVDDLDDIKICYVD